MSCLLSQLSYIAVEDMIPSDAGTPEQQCCRVPVWSEPQPLASNVDQDRGDDERVAIAHTSKFVWRRAA